MLALLEERDEPLFRTDNPFATDAWLRHWIEQIAREDWLFYMPLSLSGDPQMLLYRDPTDPFVLRSLSNYYTILAPAAIDVRELDGAVRDLAQVENVAELQLRPLDADAPLTRILEADL